MTEAGTNPSTPTLLGEQVQMPTEKRAPGVAQFGDAHPKKHKPETPFKGTQALHPFLETQQGTLRELEYHRERCKTQLTFCNLDLSVLQWTKTCTSEPLGFDSPTKIPNLGFHFTVPSLARFWTSSGHLRPQDLGKRSDGGSYYGWLRNPFAPL